MKQTMVMSMLGVLVLLSGCAGETAEREPPIPNWEDRRAHTDDINGLALGATYLPVYSDIYHIGTHRRFNLTTTVSIRNVSKVTAYVLQARYYDTAGNPVRDYLDHPIFLNPLETVEIIIPASDTQGGSGANVWFEWANEGGQPAPLFEAVMVSTHGQQGLSFSSRGVRVR